QDRRIPDYGVVLKQVSPQLVASVRDTIDSYDEAAELFVEINRHLKRHNVSGQQAAIWHACAHRGNRIDCEAAIFLAAPVPDSKRVRVYELPASTSACIIHQGSDDTVEQSYATVRSWIGAQGYVIGGPNRELHWQSSSINQQFRQLGQANMTEIQYPILK